MSPDKYECGWKVFFWELRKTNMLEKSTDRDFKRISRSECLNEKPKNMFFHKMKHIYDCIYVSIIDIIF